jgi:hypothetical protein
MKNFTPPATTALCVVLLILFSTTSIAQWTKDTSYLKKNQIKASISLIGVGPVYEYRIAKQNTLIAEIDLGFEFNSSGGYYIAPSVIAGIRQYYNLSKRHFKGKSTLNNSGNFFELSTGYVFPAMVQKKMMASSGAYLILPSWGLQRSISKKFNFEGRFGVINSYTFEDRNWETRPMIIVGLGYILR